MDDDIQLPPLPPRPSVLETLQWIDDVRRAAIRYDRERRAKVDATPVVHSARVVLTPDGSAWSHGGAAECPPPKSTVVTLRWTDDGRAWIESERNREMAQKLRSDSPLQRHFYHLIADALDGGVR